MSGKPCKCSGVQRSEFRRVEASVQGFSVQKGKSSLCCQPALYLTRPKTAFSESPMQFGYLMLEAGGWRLEANKWLISFASSLKRSAPPTSNTRCYGKTNEGIHWTIANRKL